MRAFFSPDDTLTNKISAWHLVLFAAMLPFDQFYSQVVLVSFVLHTVISLKKNDLAELLRKEVLFLLSVFLVTVVCTVYTTNKEEAFRLWSRQLAILLIPILLFLNPIDVKKYTKAVLLSFAFSSTAATLYLYGDALRIIRYNHLPLRSLFSSAFMNHNFSEPIDMHATYLSLYLALSLVIFASFYLAEKRNWLKRMYASSVFVLIPGLLQLGSRAVWIALVLIFCFAFPTLLKGRKRFLFLGISSLLLVLSVVTVATVEPLRIRYVNLLEEDLSEQSSEFSIADPRLKRWEKAVELVRQSPFIGYGSGDEVDLLKEKYFQNRLYDSYLHRLNAHNQYISFLLMGGVLALVVFLLTLFYGLRLAVRSKHLVFTGFIILLLTVSFSENILFRNKGIFFYSFFFTLFVVAACRKEQAPTKQTSTRQSGNPKRRLTVSINNT